MLSDTSVIVFHYLSNLFNTHINAERQKTLVSFICKHYLDDLVLAQKDKTLVNIFSEQSTQQELSPLEKLKQSEIETNFPKFQKLMAGIDQSLELPTNHPTIVLADKIAEAFHLSDGFERDFIRLATSYFEMTYLEPLFDDLSIDLYSGFERKETSLLAGILNRPLTEVDRGLELDAPLLACGLINGSSGSQSRDVSSQFCKLIYNRKLTLQSPKAVVLGEPTKASLTREHFEHLAEDFDLVASLLHNALTQKTVGLNILLYGSPGTGKTEMAKVIAAQIGADLYAVSETRELEPDENRNSDIMMALTLAQGDARTILMVDEAEEIFSVNPFSNKYTNKLYFNRLLENNATPIIWITNHVEAMHPAVIRRFSYAARFDSPPLTVRANIWRRELTKNQINLSLEEINELAREYALAPSFTQSAIRAASLLNDKRALKKTLDSLEKALAGDHIASKPSKPNANFKLELTNADQDLTVLTQRIVSSGRLDFSICLYGAPGTGKSEYLAYLANQMGLVPLQLRASDLLNLYLGETEKRVAEAFRVAKRDQRFLIFDEADSFLQDRRQATYSWEVSQVNEMLTWMERHPYPFACATNFMERLDEASLRRFSFKVKYSYLTPDQTLLAFAHFFGPEKAPSLNDLPVLNRLTPGDFAVVARKAAILGLTQTSELVELLLMEQAAKSAKTAVIGFSN
ncbi:MAG: ATP-binding protein [Deltaproteobacteria bacterium]|jgi:SpoVK/Ycf46/Vps4 family AAA+-type ATPase|nr:ATP-binding protein [Deltaproteobacteria bacterium]